MGGNPIDQPAGLRQMVGLAEKARREGLLALEGAIQEVPDPFMQKGVQPVVDAALREHGLPATIRSDNGPPFAGNGGYDVTREVLFALSSHRQQFEGQQSCRGRCSALDCASVLRYVVTATYR